MKKIKLAIVGPLDSVTLIDRVARERAAVLETLPIIYKDAAEVAGIVKARIEEADVWLFSGKVPYRHALSAKVNSRPLLHIPHTGSSLYRALLQATYLEKMTIDSISFDTFSQREIEETFIDCGLPLPSVMHVNDYEGIISAAAITEYHYRLWREGQSKIAVTGFLSSYEALKKLGMPAFRIAPTRHNIRSTLDIAVSTGQAMYFKDSQIAIHHIAIDNYDEVVRGAMSSYAVKKIELQLFEILVDYTEQVKGSIVIHGNGQYTIYSTRGIVAELTREFSVMPLLEEITRLAVQVSGGIGFGRTAHAAEENAHIALGLSRRAGKGKWMVVKDDRSVEGPLSSATHLKYSIRTEDGDIQLLAHKLNLSATTVNRLFAAFNKLDGQAVSADDIAIYLSITPRSARRLLGGLVENRLAEVAGEEVAGKGRPRKLYKVNLEKLMKNLTMAAKD